MTTPWAHAYEDVDIGITVQRVTDRSGKKGNA